MSRFALVLLVLFLGACRGGPEPEPAPGKALFDVPADTPLTDGMPTIWLDEPIDAAHIDSSGTDPVLRSQLEIVFANDATIGDAERVIRSVNGVIVATVAGVAGVVIRIDDPGSIEELDRVIAALEADSSVWQVLKATFPRLRVLPFDDEAGLSQSRHHLVSRATNMWNARHAASDAHVIIADYFGGGAPVGLGLESNADHYANVGAEAVNGRGFVAIGPPARPTPTPEPADHGYFVAGIASGALSATDTPTGRVTGTYPFAGRLSVADVVSSGPRASQYRALQYAQQEAGPSVLNISLGWACEGRDDDECNRRARNEGGAWALKVRQAELEDRLLIVVAAGNNPGDAASPTMPTSSVPIAAAFRDDLLGPDGGRVEPLTNTLAVSATIATSSGGVDCLAPWSYVGANVSATGDTVYSMLAEGAGFDSGTSFSAPQVAGLGAFLFSVEPELSAQDVRQVIVETARPVAAADRPECSSYATPAPQIDAYAAALALDERSDVPRVRQALLDLDGAGVSSNDLLELLDVIGNADGARDYGRADLNGDGVTGSGSAAFDLNHNGETDDLVTLLVNGATRDLNEAGVTDLDVLCYYAFSASLGLPGDGVQALEEQCGDPPTQVTVTFPAQVQSNVGGELLVTVLENGEPLEDARVSVVATDATPDMGQGQTDVDGEYRATFVPTPMVESIALEVTTTSPDGEELGVSTVVADVLPPVFDVTKRIVQARSRVHLQPRSASMTYEDEDRNDELTLTDEDRRAMSTGTLSDSGETATGTAQSSIALTHGFDESGNLTELALALASSATTTYDGTVGSAEARGAPNLQWEFYVTRDVQFDWDLTLMGVGEGGCNAAYELRATLTGSELIHSTLLADELGTLPTMGSTLFEAGEFYRISVATGSQPNSFGDLDNPAGTCTIDGAFTFAYP